MNHKVLLLAILAAFPFSINLSAQMPVQIQLAKSELSGNVSKVVEGRLYEYEEWGETKYKMDTSKVSWYDASGRKVLSMGKRVVSRYSYNQDGKISKISYSPRTSHSSNYFGELGTVLPATSADVYNYSAEGRLMSIDFKDPVEDGYRRHDIRSDLYYDNCIDVPYVCEADALEESSDYVYTVKIVFKYAPDGSYQVIMCDEEGASRRKTGVSSDGHLVVNSWGVCEYDDSGRLLSWGGEIVANNGVGKWSYMLGYDKKGNLAIKTGKEDLVRNVDKVPWLKESAKYYGATVYEYKVDASGNWTVCTEYDILRDGSKREKDSWGRIIEYDNFLDVKALAQSREDLVNKNKVAEADYVIDCFRNRFFHDLELDVTDWEGRPVYDIEKIVAAYMQYQQAMQDYQNNSDGWSKSEKREKYKEIQALGSQIYALAKISSTSEWYQWLAFIWSEYIKPEDDIHSNIYVAMDAVEKLFEINGKRSSITWNALMYLYFFLPDDGDLAQKGVVKGDFYKAHGSGLVMETKVWSKDMVTKLADDDFMWNFTEKIKDFQREFKAENRLRDDYCPM